MLFNSFSYPFFLAATVAVFWLLPGRLRQYWLALSGIVFYLAHDVSYAVLISGLSAYTFFVHFLLRKDSASWRHITVTLLPVIGTLVVFKYSHLLVSTAADVTGQSWVLPRLIMPLGISFFTFEFIHYLVDTYHKKIPRHSALDFASFIFFYPTLLAGPIKRFQPFIESVRETRWQHNVFYTGIVYIIIGYCQKYLLADPLIPFTRTLAHPEALLNQLQTIVGLLLYSWRIYFDFAGLSNIAIGSALLFGVVVPLNFDRPYLRPNIQLFWRSWHMSLSSWIRDYVYIALGGNRVSAIRMFFNLLLAMTIVGIWHGASWNFAVWGLYHGLGLVIYQLWRKQGFSLPNNWFGHLAGIGLTFGFVTIGWAFFVTTSLSDSMTLLYRFFGFGF